MAEDQGKIKTVKPKATIDWLDEKGAVKSTEEYFRGLGALHKYLTGILEKEPERKSDTLKVYLNALKDTAADNPEYIQLEVASGALPDVIDSIRKRMISSKSAVQQLQIIVAQLAEVSLLKGLVLTTVFEDASAYGFGFVSDAIDVTDADLTVLGESTISQAELFKDAMRKARNIKFPSDNPIITPGQAGMNLRVLPGGR